MKRLPFRRALFYDILCLLGLAACLAFHMAQKIVPGCRPLGLQNIKVSNSKGRYLFISASGFESKLICREYNNLVSWTWSDDHLRLKHLLYISKGARKNDWRPLLSSRNNWSHCADIFMPANCTTAAAAIPSLPLGHVVERTSLDHL